MILGATLTSRAVAFTPSAVAMAEVSERVETEEAASAEAVEPSWVTVTSACTLLVPTVALTAEASTPRAEARLAVLTVGAASEAVDVGSSCLVVSKEALDVSWRRRETDTATSHAGGTIEPQISACSAAAISVTVVPEGMLISTLAVTLSSTITVFEPSDMLAPPTAALEKASTRLWAFWDVRAVNVTAITDVVENARGGADGGLGA